MRTHVWNTLAELDPLWTVLMEPSKHRNRWDASEFFDTGESEISGVLRTCHMLGLPKNCGTALDFGCGVGRLTRALALRFNRAIGIDISAKMVENAKEMNKHIPNCEFVANETRTLPVPDSSIDLVYSVIVLQHLAKDADIFNWLDEFMRVLKPEGLLVFQLPHPFSLRRRLYLRKRAFTLLRLCGFSISRLYTMNLTPLITRGLKPEIIRQRFGPHILLEVLDTEHCKGYDSSLYFVAKN